jgi:hypothetical protein
MNAHAYKYWILVMVLIVFFGIALRQTLFRENHRSHEPSAQSADVPFSSSRQRVASKAPIRSIVSPSVVDIRESKSPMSPGSNVIPVFTPPPQAGIGNFDKSVVGSAFPISASALSACRNHGCDEVREKLTEMANEPRDNAWATQMEIEIQNNILSQGQDKYAIRDIECRSSICAIETASVEGQYLGPSYNDPLRSSLTGGELIPIWGYETDASGVRITVSVIVLMRR